MPTIRTPSGRMLNVPDNATPEQINAVLQQTGELKAPAPAPAAPRQQDLTDPDNPNNPANGDFSFSPFGIEALGTYNLPQGAGRVMAGAGRSVVNSGRSIRQMAAYLSGDKDWQNQLDQEEAQARQDDAPLMATTGGKVGSVAGDVAQMMLPAGEIGKAAQLARLGRFAPIVGGVASGAIQGALQPTTGDESRGVNIAKDAAISGAIPVLPQAIGGLKGMLLRNLSKGAPGFGQRLAGQAMGDAVAGQTVDLNTPALRSILSDYGSAIPDDMRGIMARQIRNAEAGTNGTAASPLYMGSRPMTGEASSELYSNLTQTANALKDANPAAATALNKAKRVVDASQRASLPAARYNALKRARNAFEVGTSPYGLLGVGPYVNPAVTQMVNNMQQVPPDASQ